MKRAVFIAFTTLPVLLCLPLFAHAASIFQPIINLAGGSCTCTGAAGSGSTVPSAPDWACVLQTIQVIMNDVVAFGSVIITVYIAWAGVAYLMAPINAEGRQKGRQRIVNAVLGLVIILAAWLLIDSIMKVIYNSSASASGVAQLGPWNSILSDTNTADDYCIKPITTTLPLASPTSGANAAGGNPTGLTTTPPPGTCGASSKLNCAAAVAWLQTNVTTTQDSGICLTDIQHALSAGGITLTCPEGYAGQCNSSLAALNFTSLGSSDGSPQPGDIIVVQHTTGNMIGHIAMWTGSAWVSDFIQSNSEQPPGNPYNSGFGGAEYWRP